MLPLLLATLKDAPDGIPARDLPAAVGASSAEDFRRFARALDEARFERRMVRLDRQSGCYRLGQEERGAA